MKKFIVIVGATYLATRHWNHMSEKDRSNVKQQAKDFGYKAAQFVGRELEEIDYRMAWKKFRR